VTVSAAPPSGSGEVHLPIATDTDIVVARQEGRALAARAGVSSTDLTLVATAISEIARNIVAHAGDGEMAMTIVEEDGRRGLMIVARDSGPGIDDIPQALEDGFSTGAGLGLGLPGARRIMDDFAITSQPGLGTTVVMHKWVRGSG
jgi:serine/threonine-protein kinase RsbT